MTDDRNEAYQRAADMATEAIQVVGAVHARDVQTLADAIGHLGALLDLTARLGWRTTWAKDTAILEGARDFLAAVTNEEAPSGDETSSTQDDAPGGPAGRPQGA